MRSDWTRASRAVMAMFGFALTADFQPAHAQTFGTTTCNIQFVSVQTKRPRLMIKCDAPAPGAEGAKIEFFAFHMDNEKERARLVLSLLMTAKAAGRPVRIGYQPDDKSSTEWDMQCKPAVCRPMLSVDLL